MKISEEVFPENTSERQPLSPEPSSSSTNMGMEKSSMGAGYGNGGGGGVEASKSCAPSVVCPRIRNLMCFHLADWLMAFVVTLAGWGIQPLAHGPIWQRDYYPNHTVVTGDGTEIVLLDPSLAYPLLPSIISTPMLGLLAILGPLLYIFLFNLIRLRCDKQRTSTATVDDVHHFILSLLISWAFTNVFTGAMKVCAGRYRPDWYARLQANITGNGTGATEEFLEEISDGALSYPSGHSSSAMCGLLPVSLHILAVSGAMNGRGPRGVFWKLFLAAIPVGMAVACAITRTIDYHHNFSDINAGMAIGGVAACVGYFSLHHSLLDAKAGPRINKTSMDEVRRFESASPTSSPHRHHHSRAAVVGQDGHGHV